MKRSHADSQYWFELFLVVACLALAAPNLQPLDAADPKPNVLFISIDDQNDWIGCLSGHERVQTPHIDRLARRGTCFTNAHCQAPLCNPSRTSVLTGLRPSTTGVYALAPWFRSAPTLHDYVPLPQYLHQQGYRTLSTGKIYHDAYPPRESREPGAEFDVWGYHGTFLPRPTKKFVETPDNNPLVDWGVFPERDEQQDDWKVADWAIEQLKNAASMPVGSRNDATTGQPFFLAVGFRHPHVPCYASQKWFDLYPDDDSVLPKVLDEDRADLPRFADYLHWKLPEPRLKWLRAQNQWRPLVRAYLASVSFVDSQVGRVLEALESTGLAKNTIVVLWSDHGWHLGEKGITGKNSLWEESTRVPLIFAGPGVAPRATCVRPAELLDIYPTLLELCGLPAKSELEGHSLVPQLKDANAARPWPALTTHNQNNHAVRTEAWRYIRYADGSEELYDERADPHEWRNVAREPQHAAIIRELAAWLPKVNVPPLPGSASRLLTFDNGVPVWEGKPIGATEPFPDK